MTSAFYVHHLGICKFVVSIIFRHVQVAVFLIRLSDIAFQSIRYLLVKVSRTFFVLGVRYQGFPTFTLQRQRRCQRQLNQQSTMTTSGSTPRPIDCTPDGFYAFEQCLTVYYVYVGEVPNFQVKLFSE